MALEAFDILVKSLKVSPAVPLPKTKVDLLGRFCWKNGKLYDSRLDHPCKPCPGGDGHVVLMPSDKKLGVEYYLTCNCGGKCGIRVTREIYKKYTQHLSKLPEEQQGHVGSCDEDIDFMVDTVMKELKLSKPEARVMLLKMLEAEKQREEEALK